MKKLIVLLFLFSIVVKVQGQEQQNIADMDALYQAITKMPSYKDQLKNDKTYRGLYEKLRKELNTTDELLVFQKLTQLILPLRDNHLSLARIPDTARAFKPLTPVADLQELQRKYNAYPADSIEGIYYRNGRSYLIYPHQPKVYYVQDMASKELKAILYSNKYGTYDAVQFLFGSYPYVLNRDIHFVNGLLIGLNYIKSQGKQYFAVLERKEKFDYKKLNETTGYLSLGTFSSSPQNIKQATAFFNQVKPDINTPNLIVDVRNNGGGGYKTSMQFIKWLSNFNGQVYILQNAYTVSNAEQFILKLKGKEKITTLGETTMGKITYGSNYGKHVILPSKRFSFYPTDMKGSKKELQYESTGIKPDIYLDPFSEDWITQTLKHIK